MLRSIGGWMNDNMMMAGMNETRQKLDDDTDTD